MADNFDIKVANNLFKILKSFLYEKDFKEQICDEDIKKVFSMAQMHSLSPIVFHKLTNKMDSFEKNNPTLYSQLKKDFRYTIYSSSQQDDFVNEIKQAFSNENLPIILFKGVEIKNYYPIPQLRTMGDMDCIIHKEDRQKAHQIMCQLGFDNTFNSNSVWNYKKGTLNVEMHEILAHNGIENGFDYTNYFSNVFEICEKYDNALYLKSEYNLCYLIYHIAKHLSSTGAGIRMILDVAIFTHHFEDSLDLDKFTSMLKETHLDKTADAIFSLCDKWFGTNFVKKFCLNGKIPDGLEEYIICGGVFGFNTHDTGDIYRRKTYINNLDYDKKSLKIKTIIKFFFPTIDYMAEYIPSVKKHKWLLPLAWIKRFIIGLFTRKDHSLSTFKSIKNGDEERTQKEAQMLKMMGL